MCGKGKRQTQHCRQLCAEAARPQQCDGYIAALARDRLDHLSRPLWPKIGSQLLQQRRKIVPALVQIASQRPHGSEVTARSPSQPQIDAPRIECLQRAKLFCDHQGRMVRQHHSAAAHTNGFRRPGHVANQY